jgi:SHS2 domain-containing protein
MGRYEFFDHVADVGMRIRADSPQDLFLTAAQALMAWVGPPPEGRTLEDKLAVEAEDREELLVRWLQEILCRFHLDHAYLTGARDLTVDLERRRIEASILSKIWDEEKRNNYQEVKAITYHQLRIEQQGSEWLAAVILDI